MPESFLERERKFDVDASFVLPDLDGAVPPGSVLVRSVQRLRSDYYDTADHAVRRAGLTLRRRTGTDDVGWHLKLPAGEFREELHLDLSDEVPEEFLRLLLGITRGAPLARVVTVETERAVTRVLDPAGDPVADIDLDRVRSTAEIGGRSVESSWTELEVELGSPSVSDEQLAVLSRRLLQSGARPARSASKLARAFGEPPAPTEQKSKNKKKKKKKRGRDLLLPYLVAQQRKLLLGDVALRRGDDAVVHATRVATRRLRSALRVFAPAFDARRSRALDEELRWYAGLLGAVRDTQVLAARLHESLQETAPELILGPVQQRIDAHLAAQRDRDLRVLEHELTQPRYLGLLAEIASWIDATPFTGTAKRPAAELVRLARKADRTVTRRLAAAGRTGDVDLLHRARKSAKRARYAAEIVGPAGGDRALREADRHRGLQDLLGEHQDSVVTAQLLRELGAAAGNDGENGFTFGLLYQRDLRRAEVARKRARRAARP